MKGTDYRAIEPDVDEIEQRIESLLDSDDFSTITELLSKAAEKLPENMAMTLNVTLDVFDDDREASMQLMSTGIATDPGQEPYRCHGASAPQRYIVEGQICQVPHDICPHCWGDWMFKDKHRQCPTCGLRLGKEVMLLLDTDECPYCNKGKVSRAKPTCSECGYRVDMNIATWG